MNLHDSITSVKGIGPKKADILKKELSITTIEDLLYYTPRKYIDRTSFKPIVNCLANELVTVSGTIIHTGMAGFKKKYFEVVIDDGTDTIKGVFFGGHSYFKKIFLINEYVIFSGKISYYREKQIVHPDFDFIDEESQITSINTGRIVPLYRSSDLLKKNGFDSRGFRQAIRHIFDSIPAISDNVSSEILTKYSLLSLNDALTSIHFPESFEQAEFARKRLAFNESFFMQYYLLLSKKFIISHYASENKKLEREIINSVISKLPFELTKDQERAIEEIYNDLIRKFPMNRLLQGDVGSGKTIVSFLSSIFILSTQSQVAFMAPTEVLATQHYETIRKLLPPEYTCCLLTGSTSAKVRTEHLTNIKNNAINLIIGTHALFQNDVHFNDLKYIIIDEQHRFGVEQRAKLRQKGSQAHLLVMTATPIPRSLTLTFYGDLDVSYLREKPKNRKNIKTLAFPESKLQGVYNSIKKYISEGKQVYYVLPLIEDSEKLDLQSAEKVHEKLSKDIFPHFTIALLHSKIATEDKKSIMDSFKQGKINILVSTTVIEVGIDVPNATVMVIHHAERFGLSQLHQLRGRVGRGDHQSFCVLIYPISITEESKKRIDIIVSSVDGFFIAEEDLKLRGTGELIGIKQHDHDGFEFTSLSKDLDLIQYARREAEIVIDAIKNIDKSFTEVQGGNYDYLLKGIRTKRILELLN